MITDPVLVDTGPIVAILNENDQFHGLCVAQSQKLKGPLLTTWLVVTEAAWLLRDVPQGLNRLLNTISAGRFRCMHLDRTATDIMARAAAKYQDLSPQIADLSLLYLAE